MKKIVVDAGRSSIKSIHIKAGKFIKNKFDSKLGIANFDFLKTTPVITFDKTKDTIAKIDDSKPLIMGETCDMLLAPEKIIYAGNDEIYLKYAIHYTLVSVARFAEDNDEVVLAINLTFNNINHTDEIKEKLKKEHCVTFYNTTGKILKKVTFKIVKLLVFYQGWTSVISKALNKNLEINETYLKDGIIIDIGRKTTDIALVRKLANAKGRSFEHATENIFSYIGDILYQKYSITKDTKDIESLIVNDDTIYSRNGDEIKIRDHLKEAVLVVAEQIKASIIENFGAYTPSWVILTGGGVVYFQDILKFLFKNLVVMEDYIFSNSIGMAKLLQKFEGK